MHSSAWKDLDDRVVLCLIKLSLLADVKEINKWLMDDWYATRKKPILPSVILAFMKQKAQKLKNNPHQNKFES